jgi:hypothetical protein
MSQFDSRTSTWFVKNKTYWTSLTADGGHPNGINNNGATWQPVEHWAVRRWKSDYDGQVSISGLIADLNSGGGNGVIGQIFVDNKEVGT